MSVTLCICLEDILGNRDTVPPFLTLVLDGGEWSASHLSCFTPGKELPVPTG
jgi:hypothetical protein